MKNENQKEYELWMKRFKIASCISSDVTSRFFHQLSYQDNFVIKEYFSDAAQLYASIINAVLEAMIQHIGEMTESETGKLIGKISEAWGESEEYEEFDGVDIRHEIKKVIECISKISFIACDELTTAQIEKAELCKHCFRIGDVDRTYWSNPFIVPAPTETATSPDPNLMA